jgi:hypothetical protein
MAQRLPECHAIQQLVPADRISCSAKDMLKRSRFELDPLYTVSKRQQQKTQGAKEI